MTYSHSQWPLTQSFTKSSSPHPTYPRTKDPNSEPYLSTQFHPKQHLYQLPEASPHPVTPPSAPPAAKRRQWRIFPWSARKLLCWKRWKDGTGRKEGIYRDFWSDVWRMIDTLIVHDSYHLLKRGFINLFEVGQPLNQIIIIRYLSIFCAIE